MHKGKWIRDSEGDKRLVRISTSPKIEIPNPETPEIVNLPIVIDWTSLTHTTPSQFEQISVVSESEFESLSLSTMSVHGDNESQQGGDDLKYDPQIPTLRQLLQPERNATPSCILLPATAGNFHFRNGMIQLIPIFHGLDGERPYLHIREFEEVCATFNDQNCPEDVIRLKLFPFSLKDKSKT